MSTHAAHSARAMELASERAEQSERLLDATSLSAPLAPTTDHAPLTTHALPIDYELALLIADLGLAISKSTAGVRIKYRERADGIADRLGALIETMTLDGDIDIPGFAADAALTLSDAASWLQTRKGHVQVCVRARAMSQRLRAIPQTESQPRPTGSAGRG